MNYKYRIAIYTTIILSLSLIPIISCGQSAKNPNLTDITGISVMGDIRVELYKSDTVMIKADGDQQVMGNLIMEKEDGILSIRFRTKTPRGTFVKLQFYHPEPVYLEVKDEALIINADTLNVNDIQLKAASGGKMELKLQAKNIESDVKQGAILVLYGKAGKQIIEVGSGGSYSAYNLEARDSEVKAVMGGRAMVTTRRILNARAVTRGFVGYKGGPVSVSADSSLGGEIIDYSEDSSE